jgi:hypothetical protein
MAEELISSLQISTTSDVALAEPRPGLVALGFDVEAGKRKVDKLRRPLPFGERGAEDLAYEVDAFHAAERIALEWRARCSWERGLPRPDPDLAPQVLLPADPGAHRGG